MTHSDTLHAIHRFKSSGGIAVLETLSEDALSAMVICANENYYNVGSDAVVLLSDNEYDVLKEFLESKFPQNTAVRDIGAPPIERNKVTLPYEMPSMDKIKPDSGALASWTHKYKGPYMLSCKLDGVSGMYSLENNTPKLYTRGNGKVGQDVSHLIAPLGLPKCKTKLTVRGEFILTKTAFRTRYASRFANARNLVAGIVNRQTIDDQTQSVEFVAYEVISPAIKPSEQMEFLKTHGFNVVHYCFASSLTNTQLSETLVDWRANCEYDIDGVIVTHDDVVYPRRSGNPEHAFAFKMVLSDQMAEAKVVNVIWTASKDGLLKPRVQIERVRLGGVTIEFATGFNAAFIETNKIGVGAVIQLIRSGDVIPYIQRVIVPAERPLMPHDVDYHWNDTHVDILLDHAEDDATVREKNLTGFFKGIEVEGLGAGNVAKIVAAGFDSIPKIIRMSKADFLSVEGFQEKMATKVHDGIQQRLSQASIGTIMSASNIFGRGFGDRKIQLVLDELGPAILTSTDSNKVSRVAAIDGLATKTASAFVSQIPTFLSFLEECGLQGKIIPAEEQHQQPQHHSMLNKKSIVMSGTRDKGLEQKLKDVGAKLASSVSKNTFAVITPDKTSVTGKVNDARIHGVTVYTPDEFCQKYL
jgi:NAD-dependent DNA ligase